MRKKYRGGVCVRLAHSTHKQTCFEFYASAATLIQHNARPNKIRVLQGENKINSVCLDGAQKQSKISKNELNNFSCAGFSTYSSEQKTCITYKKRYIMRFFDLRAQKRYLKTGFFQHGIHIRSKSADFWSFFVMGKTNMRKFLDFDN